MRAAGAVRRAVQAEAEPLALTVHVLLLLTAVGPGVHRAAPGVPSPGPHHEAAVRQTGAEDSALGGHLDGRTQ